MFLKFPYGKQSSKFLQRQRLIFLFTLPLLPTSQTHRRGTGVFAGKQGFITLRDLFKWAERYSRASAETSERFYDWDQLLADNGQL